MKLNLSKLSTVVKKSGILILLGFFLATSVSAIFPPKAQAATPEIQKLIDEAKAFTLYRSTTYRCIMNDSGENFLESRIDLGGDTSATNIYDQIFDVFDNSSVIPKGHDYTIYPGEAVVSGGKYDCIKDGTKIFPKLGFNSAIEFMNLFYNKTGDNNYKLKTGIDYKKVFTEFVKDKVQIGPDNDLTKLSDGAKYYLYWSTLKSQCGLKKADDDVYNATENKKKAELWESSKGELKKVKYTISTAESVFLGDGVNSEPSFTANGKVACSVMLEKLAPNKGWAETYANIAKKDGDTSSIGETVDSSVGSGAETPSCETESSDEGWFMCPAIRIVGSGLASLDTGLSDLLSVDKSKYTNSNMYQAWSQFRNIAITLLILVMIVMVISTALGIQALDAYTVKKAMPRMVAAILFILLSWYICGFLINLSNVVGKGTLGIMVSPFPGAKGQSLASLFGDSTVGNGIALGGGIAIGVGAIGVTGALAIIFSWLMSGLLIALIAFVVMIARQMFIIVLILGAPLAILAWIFPGNDKLWKAWWQMFSKLLLMYPLIMALIGSGRIFSTVVSLSNESDFGATLLNPVLKLTAYFLPYAFIPFTFKAAGGVFGNLVGMANDRSRGAFDRLKKGRQKGMGEIGQRVGAGVGFRKGFGGLNGVAAGVSTGPKGWVSPGKRKGMIESRMTALGAAATKNDPIYEANKNNDAFTLAVASESVAKQKINALKAKRDAAGAGSAEAISAQAEINTRQRALDMARAMPNKNAAVRRQAALDLAATGYQFKSGEEGYNEMAAIGREIHGSDDAAFGSYMNNMQYNAKGAGRFDLAGINHGNGYDAKAGTDKASLYELANAKKESIGAMMEGIPEGGSWDVNQAKQAAVVYSEMKAMLPNAKGASRDKILENIQKLEANNVESFMKAPNVDPATGAVKQISERVAYNNLDPSHATWSSEDQIRGYRIEQRNETLGDVAQREARTYERPDPNKL